MTVKVLGGRLAEMYGTKKVFGISNLLVAACALVTPVLAKVDVWCVIILRLVQVCDCAGADQHSVYEGLPGGLRLSLPPHDGQQVGAGGREVSLHLLRLCRRDVWVRDHQPAVWADHLPPGLGGEALRAERHGADVSVAGRLLRHGECLGRLVPGLAPLCQRHTGAEQSDVGGGEGLHPTEEGIRQPGRQRRRPHHPTASVGLALTLTDN